MDIESITSEIKQAVKKTRLAVEESRDLLAKLNEASEEARKTAEETGILCAEIRTRLHPKQTEQD